MDYEEIISKTKTFAQRVVDEFHPKKIILYGSYANGTANQNSDIDIAVICETVGSNFLIDAQKLYKIRRGIDTRIEPVLIEEGNDLSGFYEEITKNGMLIYQSTEN